MDITGVKPVGTFASEPLSPDTPEINTRLGWLLVVVGLAGAIWLDPWSLRMTDTAALGFALRVAARQGQAAVLSMAFLQLAFGALLARCHTTGRMAKFSVWLTALGAMAYAAGYALAVPLPVCLWGVPFGALLNLCGCLLLASILTEKSALLARLILCTFAFGMFLDIVTGLFAVQPFWFRPEYLGSIDGVRLRMLRLAQVAAIALPILTGLHYDLARKALPNALWTRRARLGMIGGMMGMPVVLALAAFNSVSLKYLLPLPAFSVFGATVNGVLLARRTASRLEMAGWTLIALSMGTGLLMGMYAFNGPLQSPHFLGEYNDFVRRCSRLGHAYCILLGLLSLFVARLGTGELAQTFPMVRQTDFPNNIPVTSSDRLLVGGIIITLLAIQLVAIRLLPVGALSIGPALTATATLLILRRWV